LRALREHWADRGRDFDAPLDSAPLIVPLVIPETRTALNKHGGAVEAPHTTDAFGHLVRSGDTTSDRRVWRGCGHPDSKIWLSSRTPPRTRSGHGDAARVARDMPVDVCSDSRPASLQTTSIYCAPSRAAQLRDGARVLRRG